MRMGVEAVLKAFLHDASVAALGLGRKAVLNDGASDPKQPLVIEKTGRGVVSAISCRTPSTSTWAKQAPTPAAEGLTRDTTSSLFSSTSGPAVHKGRPWLSLCRFFPTRRDHKSAQCSNGSRPVGTPVWRAKPEALGGILQKRGRMGEPLNLELNQWDSFQIQSNPVTTVGLAGN